jgi:hypothetical protein
VRFAPDAALHGEELRAAARTQLRRHLDRRPASNPFPRFAAQLERDLPRLLEGDIEDYHAYAFATVRMVGSAFEVAASHARWLLGERADAACQAFGQIVEGSKALSFRLARRRPFDPHAAIAALAVSWDEAMEQLDGALA